MRCDFILLAASHVVSLSMPPNCNRFRKLSDFLLIIAAGAAYRQGGVFDSERVAAAVFWGRSGP